MTDADSFIAGGFVRVEGAFSREPAADCREVLGRDTGCAPC